MIFPPNLILSVSPFKVYRKIGTPSRIIIHVLKVTKVNSFQFLYEMFSEADIATQQHTLLAVMKGLGGRRI